MRRAERPPCGRSSEIVVIYANSQPVSHSRTTGLKREPGTPLAGRSGTTLRLGPRAALMMNKKGLERYRCRSKLAVVDAINSHDRAGLVHCACQLGAVGFGRCFSAFIARLGTSACVVTVLARPAPDVDQRNAQLCVRCGRASGSLGCPGTAWPGSGNLAG